MKEKWNPLKQKKLYNVVVSENRSSSFESAIQSLIDSSKARLLNQPEYNWWMYHYEVETYGSSSILTPASNPFLSTLPPDGSNDYEPLVMICHQTPSGSIIGCYGIWQVFGCEPEDLDGLDCCDLEVSDCEGETCLCRVVET